MRLRALLVALGLAAASAGCGGDVEPLPGADAPAVTAPGSTEAYGSGGADGSGADGRDAPNPRGGVGASADSSDAREAD